MKFLKSMILIIYLSSIFSPAGIAVAQETPSETIYTQTDINTVDPVFSTQDDMNKIKVDKKKKKKNLIDLNAGFFWNLLINIATVMIIIGLVYYPIHKKTDYIFTFIMFNIVIFLLTFVLDKVKISMGAAFGLFAIFSMLRYRTEGISIKDMTYLFICIAIGLVSAIRLEHYELVLINGTIIAFTYMFDGNFLMTKESVKNIEYENIELIKPEKEEELLKDLKNRTGLDIHRYTITKINFLRDTATIKVYYYEK